MRDTLQRALNCNDAKTPDLSLTGPNPWMTHRGRQVLAPVTGLLCQRTQL